MGCMVASQALFKQFERIGVLYLRGLERAPARPCALMDWHLLDLYSASPGLEAQEWAGAEKAITSQPLAADNAFEKKGPVPFPNLAKRADRRERVADELAIHRHQARVPGEFCKFIEGREVTHGSSSARFSKRSLYYERRESSLTPADCRDFGFMPDTLFSLLPLDLADGAC